MQYRRLVVLAVMLSMFMAAMEATVVATAMPTVVADLHGIELYGYVGSLYILASTVAVPLAGKLADRKGRRFTFVLGQALFLLGSIASGAAPSMGALVAARVVQGIGAGALQPLALIVIADIFSIEERGRFQGLFGVVWGLAGVSGPLLGGLIVNALSWRWVFYVNLPIGLVSLALFLFAYREVRAQAATARIDLAGAALLAAGVTLLLAATSGVAPWLTVPLALIAVPAFLWVEHRAEDPVLPLALFRRRLMAVGSVVGVLAGTIMMTTMMYVPLYVQAVLGSTPTEAGSAIAPMLIGWPLSSALTGRVLFRLGPRPVVRFGCAAIAASALALPWCVEQRLALQAAMFVFGVGMGAFTIALVYSVQEDAAPEHRGVASATTLFFRSIGGAIAVGVFGAIFARALAGTIPDELISRVLEPHPSLAVDPAAREAFRRALQPLFGIESVLGLLTLAVAWLFPKLSWQKKSPSDPTADGAVAMH